MCFFEILRDLGIFGIAAWFLQHLISKSADRKFETYKSELDQKAREFQALLDSKLELYKIELNLQNYKSTKIYEQQLLIIIELHKKLIDLNRSMLEMTGWNEITGMPEEEIQQKENEQIDSTARTYNEFMSFYQDNLIFFPQKTVEKIDYIRTEYFNSFHDYTFGKKFGITSEFTFKQAVEASKKIRDVIQPAIEQLVNDFRNILGVNKNNFNENQN